MNTEKGASAHPRTNGEVESPLLSRRSKHSHRDDSAHRSSEVNTAATRKALVRGDEMAGLQVERRVSSRHHHSHSHRHRHRSHRGEQSAREERDDEGKAGKTDNGATTLQDKEGAAAPPPPQLQQQQKYEAPESSRASTRSSRLPARRSERGSVAGPGSTYGDVNFHEVHPSGEVTATATVDHPSRRPSQLSAAPSSSANLPSTSELSAMMKRGTAAAATSKAVTNAAVRPAAAAAASATHSASFSSSSYSSHEGGIDFHTETQHKTATTTVDPQLETSHTASSTHFSESSHPYTTHPVVANAAAVATAPPPPSTSVSSRKESHHSPSPQPQQQQQPADTASKLSRTEKASKPASVAAPTSVKERPSGTGAVAPASSRRMADQVASLRSVPSPPPANAAAVVVPKPSTSPAAAALAALQTTPQQPEALVRSWQADVAPDAHNPPSSLTSSVCHRCDKEDERAAAPPQQQQPRHRSRSSRKQRHGTAEDAAPARSSHRHRHGEAHQHRHASTPPAASLHRDSRSSSKYEKVTYPPPPPSASVKSGAAAEAKEESKPSVRGSVTGAAAAVPAAHDTASEKPFATSPSNGRSPQRTRASSATASRRRPTEFEPFQLNTERRSTLRRTTSPQAYVAHDPLMELPKEERERLMGLPHEVFNAPGMWRLDMRYEEDRKEYFRQTHLVDPMTRTRPGMRQFYIPEQADLFGMHPDIPMTKDEEGNDIVEHRAPIPIRGESFVKARKSYAQPRPSPQRKSAVEESLDYSAPQPNVAASKDAAGAGRVGRPSRGLSGFVWGYGEEASGRPGGLTPPRGRVVSDITAPYRRNPAKSTGQIGHLGGDGTLNIFRTSSSADVEGSGGERSASQQLLQQQQQQQQHAGLVGTPPQMSFEQQQMRDISQASTSFAIMHPTPSPSVPTTTNSDYGRSPQRYAEAAAAAVPPPPPPPPQAPSVDEEPRRRDAAHHEQEEKELTQPLVPQQQKQQQQATAHSRPTEAVVLQPSIGGNSGSRSPSEGLFAPVHTTTTTGAQAAQSEAAPMTIQTGSDLDTESAAKSLDRRLAAEDAIPKEVPRSSSYERGDGAERSASDRSSKRPAKEVNSRPTTATTTSDAHKRHEAAVEVKPTTASEKPPSHASEATEKSRRAAEKKAPPSVAPSSAAVSSVKDDIASAAPPPSSPPSAVKCSRTTPAPSVISTTASAAAVAPTRPPQLAAQHPAEVGTVASSSGVQTPTSAKPDSSYPVPSPAPVLPASSSSRISKEREKQRVANAGETKADCNEAKRSTNASEKMDDDKLRERHRKDRPSRASSSADVPPPLPPPPSTQRPAATAPPPPHSSAANSTREASINMTDVASMHEEHYDPTAMSEGGARAAASAAPSHRSAAPAAAAATAGSVPKSSRNTTAASSVGSSHHRSENKKNVEEASERASRHHRHDSAAPTDTQVSSPSASAAPSVATSTRRSSVAVGVTSEPAAAAPSESKESRTNHRTDGRSHREHRDSVSSQTSAVSESEAPSEGRASGVFSQPRYAYTSGSATPVSSAPESRYSYNSSNNHSKNHHGGYGGSSSSAGAGFREKPVVAESGTQTDFVFVLDPLQGRQFAQREQEQQILLEQLQQRPQNVLHITDTRRSSSGVFTNFSTPRQSQTAPAQQPSVDRSVSPSEQRAAGVSTGVSPTRMRRIGYANTSTNVRDLLRWN
jgi:hypothetical protein